MRVQRQTRNASENARTNEQSKEYLERVLRYPKNEVQLLYSIFRNKLVHLSQPKIHTGKNNQVYTWKYYHNFKDQHLQITPLKIAGHFEFSISIWTLVEDITDSVFKPNGYLFQLKENPLLQQNFIKAYNQIHKL